MKKAIADKIRMARLSKSLSQENMANELGLSTGAYSNIERGVTDISVSRLLEIAEIFKVSILTFFENTKEANWASENNNSSLYPTSSELHNTVKLLQQEVQRLTAEMNKLKNTEKKAIKRKKK